MEAEREVPDDLDPPELLPELESILDAFHELSSDRQIGMGIGPIPASSIARHTAGWPHDDAWAFRFCMRKLDEAFFEHQNKKQPPREIVNGEDRLRAIFGDRLD